MTPETPVLEAAIGAAVGRAVTIDRRARLSGGDISVVERVATTAGAFIVKSGTDVAGLFRAEADGLRALRTTGTSLRVPDVVALEERDPAFLVLEDLGSGRPGRDHDERAGRGLAELHRATAPAFGFDADNFCGATPQPNPHLPGWVEFYSRARLGHQLELGARAGLYSVADRRLIEMLIGRLASWIDEPADGPALIHGDLWAGNLLVTGDGQPALIDPAVYFAHREAELGMMTLFGAFPSRLYDAYDEALPLEPDWRDRNPLYQLYHLMNHATIFGRSYHGQVMATVRRYV